MWLPIILLLASFTVQADAYNDMMHNQQQWEMDWRMRRMEMEQDFQNNYHPGNGTTIDLRGLIEWIKRSNPANEENPEPEE